MSFKRLGLDAEVFLKIGTDIAGQFIEQALLHEKITLAPSSIKQEIATAISFIIPSIEHNHVALCYRGTHTSFNQSEIPLEKIESCDYLYISPLSAHSAAILPFLARYAKEKNIPVGINPSIGQIRESTALIAALPSIDTLIVNAYEAAHLMQELLGKTCPMKIEKKIKEFDNKPRLLTHFMVVNDTILTLFDYFDRILNSGPSLAAVTNGAEGVYVATKDTLYFHPSLKTDVVSGLGAGDAFSSAFIASLALGKKIEQAIIYGIINASSVIQFPDAKEGLLSIEDLEQRAQLLGLEQLHKISRENRSIQ